MPSKDFISDTHTSGSKQETHGTNFIYVTALAPSMPFAAAIKIKKLNLDILPLRQ